MYSRIFDRNDLLYAIGFAFIISGLGCHSADLGSVSRETAPIPQVLRIATSGDYAPFSRWHADANSPLGFSISVAEAYALEHGAGIEWIRFRWPELATDLVAGGFDLALSGITIRPDRTIQGRFSLPLTSSGAVVLVLADSPLESVADLDRPSIQIAVNAGGHLERVSRRLFPSVQLEAIADNGKVLGRLVNGVVDGVVTDTLEAPHWQRSARAELRVIGPLTRDLKAAWFPPTNEQEALRFDRWLLRAEASGLLRRLRHEHGLPEGRTANPLPALLSSLNERLMLMTAVADAKQILGAAIENPAREEVVLDAAIRAIQTTALEAAIPPPDVAMIRRLFRAQIESAKWIQNRQRRDAPVRTNPAASIERRDARTTLDDVIRPALLYLGNRISMLIVACVAEPTKVLAYEDVAHALERHDLPETQLRALYEALSAIVTRERSSGPARRPSPARTSTASSA